ncbi:MAG: hypothetical protein ABIA91_00085, partial [Patescibacteria group bacterium]
NKIKKFGTDSLAYGKKKAIRATKTGLGTTKVVRRGLATAAPNTLFGRVAQDRINKERDAKVAKRLNRLKKFGASDETFEYLNKKHQDKLTKPKDKDVLARKASIRGRLQAENPKLSEEELNNRIEGEYANNPVKTKYTQKLEKEKKKIDDYNKEKGIDMDIKDVEKKAKMKMKGGMVHPFMRRSTFISEVADKYGVAKASDKNTKMWKAAYKKAKEENPDVSDEDKLRDIAFGILADMQYGDITAKYKKSSENKSKGTEKVKSKESSSSSIITENLNQEFTNAKKEKE